MNMELNKKTLSNAFAKLKNTASMLLPIAGH
jgi:hypothetical protein